MLPILEDERRVPRKLTAEQLARKAETPASELYVDTELDEHVGSCIAIRQLRRWAMLACILLGIVLALNAVITVAGPALITAKVQEVVRAELAAQRPHTRLGPPGHDSVAQVSP